MHEEVLSPAQVKLLPLLKLLSGSFGLIGGTATALQLGHRKSFDFDLITVSDLRIEKVRNQIIANYKINQVLVDETNEFTIIVDGVKLTFLKYPFAVELNTPFKDIIKLPNLVTLAAMKAYTLGRRAKWKDYVDLYFIFGKYQFCEVIDKAKGIYGNEFNEKILREQLAYFADIDYTEKIDYLPGLETEDETIKEKLTNISLQQIAPSAKKLDQQIF